MTSYQNQPTSAQGPRLNVDTKAKPYQTNQAPYSATTALTNQSRATDVSNPRVVDDLQNDLHDLNDRVDQLLNHTKSYSGTPVKRPGVANTPTQPVKSYYEPINQPRAPTETVKSYYDPTNRPRAPAETVKSYYEPTNHPRAPAEAVKSSYIHKQDVARDTRKTSIQDLPPPKRYNSPTELPDEYRTTYLQYHQAPVQNVHETRIAHREKEVPVQGPKERTYVQYHPEAYEVTEEHTDYREREVTVQVPKNRTFVHYQPETYEVTEEHIGEREKEITYQIPVYTTYHTHQPEAYEIIETHTAYREKEVTVEVPITKEITYCTPGEVEIVQDYIPPKEHVVYTPVQTVRYELVHDFKSIVANARVNKPATPVEVVDVQRPPVTAERPKNAAPRQNYNNYIPPKVTTNPNYYAPPQYENVKNTPVRNYNSPNASSVTTHASPYDREAPNRPYNPDSDRSYYTNERPAKSILRNYESAYTPSVQSNRSPDASYYNPEKPKSSLRYPENQKSPVAKKTERVNKPRVERDDDTEVCEYCDQVVRKNSGHQHVQRNPNYRERVPENNNRAPRYYEQEEEAPRNPNYRERQPEKNTRAPKYVEEYVEEEEDEDDYDYFGAPEQKFVEKQQGGNSGPKKAGKRREILDERRERELAMKQKGKNN